ncbi:hypothetical protein [Glaciihabitans sp. dw_435]|uniref:hypothetical protein n=1 Tax=Glaciihabitans sp. dw_435 TaxID=2720081 RepID=UPI001BD3B4FA|nr:hypothetical protein [Glaciihabitans sp. dw_435]
MIDASVRPVPSAATSAPDSTSPAALTLEQALVLNRVTTTAWQVCDSRREPHSPGHLLGFVENVGDGVELMQLGDKFIWTRFPDMNAALAHVCATARATEDERASGELAWLI